MDDSTDTAPDFNQVLADLQKQQQSAPPEPDPVYSEVTDENVNQFILDRGAKLVEDSLDAFNRVKDRITAAHDPDELAAMTQLIKATTGALETLTKISIQNKKDAVVKETTNTKQLIAKTINDAVMVGTREEAYKRYLETNTKEADIESVTEAPYTPEKAND